MKQVKTRFRYMFICHSKMRVYTSKPDEMPPVEILGYFINCTVLDKST